MVHPNDVDSLYKVISDVYCAPEMKNLAKDLVLHVSSKTLQVKHYKPLKN